MKATQKKKTTTRKLNGNGVYAVRKRKCVQGRNASSAGKRLEDFVENTLVERGAYPVRYSRWNDNKIFIPKWTKKVLFKQVPYVKLWGGRGYSDFVLEKPTGRIRIDVRSQEIPGSVEEKVCYLFQTAEKCYPEQEVIIVLDGAGVKPEIREWLIGMANSVKHKTIKVFTKEQFKEWANTI